MRERHANSKAEMCNDRDTLKMPIKPGKHIQGLPWLTIMEVNHHLTLKGATSISSVETTLNAHGLTSKYSYREEALYGH